MSTGAMPYCERLDEFTALYDAFLNTRLAPQQQLPLL
jgi:hypothetical protein